MRVHERDGHTSSPDRFRRIRALAPLELLEPLVAEAVEEVLVQPFCDGTRGAATSRRATAKSRLKGGCGQDCPPHWNGVYLYTSRFKSSGRSLKRPNISYTLATALSTIRSPVPSSTHVLALAAP